MTFTPRTMTMSALALCLMMLMGVMGVMGVMVRGASAQAPAPDRVLESAPVQCPAPAKVAASTPSKVAQAARSLRKSLACDSCGGDGVIVRQRTKRAEKLFTKGQIYHEEDACVTCGGTGAAKPALILSKFNALVLAMAGCPDELAKSAPTTKILGEVFDAVAAFAKTPHAESIEKAAEQIAGGFGDAPGEPIVAIGLVLPAVEFSGSTHALVIKLPSGGLVALHDCLYHSAKPGDRALGTGVICGHATIGKDEYLVVDRGIAIMVTSEEDLKIQAEEAEAARRAAREPAAPSEPRAPDPAPPAGGDPEQ